MADSNAGNLDPLEKTYVGYASAVMSCMVEKAIREGVPMLGRQRVEFSGDQMQLANIPEPFYEMLGHRCLASSPDLRQMEEQCARKHWDAGIFRSPPIPRNPGNPEMCETFDQAKRQISSALLQPVVEAWRKTGSVPVPEVTIIDQYRRSMASWTATHNRVRQIVPLLQVKSDITDEIAIGTSFTLSPFGPKQKTEAYSYLGTPFSVGLQEGVGLTNAQLMLSRAIQMEKRSRTFDEELAALTETTQEITDIVTAMRLLKPGCVGAPMLYEIWDEKLPWGYGSMGRGVGAYPVVFRSDFHLIEAEVPAINEMYESLQALDKKKEPRGGLEIALRYLNQSYTRTSLEDRIVDLTIVLESSLLHKERDELKFRASLLGAALLSGQRPPKDTFNLIGSLYDVRSGIVHNGKTIAELETERKRQDVGSFCHACEDLVRAILRSYVERLASEQDKNIGLQKLNQRLKDHIVDRLRFP